MKRILINELENHINDTVLIKGWVFKIRKLKAFSFVIIRDRSGFVQTIIDNSLLPNPFTLESTVEIYGKVVAGKNDFNPFEIQVTEMKIISLADELPIEINKPELEVNLDTMLNNRVLSLRHEKKNVIFKFQNIITASFREYLRKHGFTEIFTPKIVAEGAEGGSEIFKVDYFGNQAYLTQSPQFFKQMLVAAGYERVFEVAAAYRAEEHNTNRHLNEYISLDVELGFIEDFNEVMDLEEALLKYILKNLASEGEEYIKKLSATLPDIKGTIPRMPLKEAIEILNTRYNKELEGDLDPEGEKLICQYVKETYDSDFVFLTHYPRSKRPMYTMPCGDNETYSFDLLFRGIEITTGGQRIHDYNMLVDNMKYKGLVPENYEVYLSTFKHGAPPHGGFAIGLERLTAMLLGFNNVRETSFFPRDRTRY